MIGEAVDTAVTLGWALAAWIAVGAFVGAVVLLGGTAVGAWAVRGLWRIGRDAWTVRASRKPQEPAGAPHAPSGASRILRAAPEAPQPPSRPAPSWARKDAV